MTLRNLVDATCVTSPDLTSMMASSENERETLIALRRAPKAPLMQLTGAEEEVAVYSV